VLCDHVYSFKQWLLQENILHQRENLDYLKFYCCCVVV